MKISDFTVQELHDLVQKCNFTKDELVLFNLRSRDFTLEQSAEIMNLSVSSVKRLSQHIKWKIERVNRQ